MHRMREIEFFAQYQQKKKNILSEEFINSKGVFYYLAEKVRENLQTMNGQ